MQNDDEVIVKIDAELSQLQNTLKDRLKETNDLTDLNKSVFKSSLKIEEKTSTLEKTAKETKWKWLLEYAKWMFIAGAIILLLLVLLIRTFIK